MQVAITSPVIYPNFNNYVSSSTFSILQYSYAFSQLGCIGSIFFTFSCCCTFPLIGCTASSCLLFSFSTSMFGHFYLQCPIPLYLKHCTFFTISCLLTFTPPPTPYYITLLAIISNLFWEIGFLFVSLLLFLQLWARYPNFLQYQHILSFLPSNSTLSLARACF